MNQEVNEHTHSEVKNLLENKTIITIDPSKDQIKAEIFNNEGYKQFVSTLAITSQQNEMNQEVYEHTYSEVKNIMENKTIITRFHPRIKVRLKSSIETESITHRNTTNM